MDVVHVTPQVREKMRELSSRIIEIFVEKKATPVEAAATLQICAGALSEMYGMQVTLLANAKVGTP